MTGSFLQKISQNRWTAVTWTVVIFVLMIIPRSGIPNRGLFGIPHLDKVVHVIMFGLFVWLWFQASTKNKKHASSRMAWILFLVAVCYGTAMEFVQHYFTDRDFDSWDILADSAGALAAFIMVSPRAKK